MRIVSKGRGDSFALAIICWKPGRESVRPLIPSSRYSATTTPPILATSARHASICAGIDRSFSACFAVEHRA
jgi:hypothetical protein